MPAIITSKMRLHNAQQFSEALSETALTNLYMFIGKVTPWTVDSDPQTPLDNDDTERLAWEDMVGGKKISAADVSHVIRRVDWTSGTVYVRYDDQDEQLYIKDFYVVTDEFNVYKCIDNNAGAQSTVKPTGTGTAIITLGDGYKWKYLYTINTAEALAFMTLDWMPVKELLADDGSNQWTVQQNTIDGGLHSIEVTGGGSGYTSPPTVTITGDGVGATATATLTGDVVTNIDITAAGSGYNEATVTLSGGGFTTPATARAILSPAFGHGKNALKELGGFYVMVGTTLTEDEMDNLPITNDFRKVGMIRDPFLYGTETLSTQTLFNQTFALQLNPGYTGTFNVDEDVTGTTSGAVGKVVRFDSVNDIIYVTDVEGAFDNVEAVSSVSGSGSINNVTNPTLQPRSGDILFVENRTPISRSLNQAEQIRVILEF